MAFMLKVCSPSLPPPPPLCLPSSLFALNSHPVVDFQACTQPAGTVPPFIQSSLLCLASLKSLSLSRSLSLEYYCRATLLHSTLLCRSLFLSLSFSVGPETNNTTSSFSCSSCCSSCYCYCHCYLLLRLLFLLLLLLLPLLLLLLLLLLLQGFLFRLL